MTSINLIVTCTNKKRVEVPKRLRLRTVRVGDAKLRAEKWTEKLASESGITTRAVDLYSGDHWFVARDLPRSAEARGADARLWVSSAGYGLIPHDAPVSSYSATFTPENLDAVRRLASGFAEPVADREWWSALARWCGPVAGAPRSVAELAASDPRSPILVVASKRYVAAMSDDLLAARSKLRDPGTLLIFSSGTSEAELGDLAGNSVPCDARFQSVAKGARFSLSARAARFALDQHRLSLNATVLRRTFSRLLKKQPPPVRYERDRMTDVEVEAFIRSRLARRGDSKAASRTGLLRELRASGRACEQARFGDLFTRTMEKMHGR